MRITISKQSWHYRWYQKLFSILRSDDEWKDPKSICPYFWGFLFHHVLALMIGAVVVAGSVMAFMCTIGLPILYWSWLANGSQNAGFFALLFSLADIVVLTFYLIHFIKYNKDEWAEGEPVGFAQITYHAAKSFKDKVCPLVEYKD